MSSITHTKANLMEMNNSKLGRGWIKNIERIGELELAKIYPTGDAGLASGRIYIALPASLVITDQIRQQYNIW
jgi:hypothetical protein